MWLRWKMLIIIMVIKIPSEQTKRAAVDEYDESDSETRKVMKLRVLFASLKMAFNQINRIANACSSTVVYHNVK